MNSSRSRKWYEPQNAYWDIAVIFTILAIINFVLRPKDIGMTQINPSPYILLPVLIGCRYGFVEAIKSCLVVILGHIGILYLTDHVSISDLIYEHGFFYAGLVFFGGVCGEVHAFFMTQETEIKLINDRLVSRHTSLEEAVYELNQIKKKFEEELVSYGSETASLDMALRRLMECEKESIYSEILRLFNRFYDVQTAGIYLQDSLKTIRRQAYIGSYDGFTEIINLDDDLLARKCLSTNCPVSIKTFSDLEVTQIHHLVALPVSTSSNEASGVIFINAMPFNRLTEASVEGMELLAHWASRALEIHHERWLVEMVGDQRVEYKVISNEAFSDIIHIAKRTSAIYQIPSFMVLLYANGEYKNIEEQLKNRFLPQIRRGDFVTTLDLPFSNIAVLLPIAGRRSVEIFLDRMNEVIASNPQLTGKIRNITKIVDDQFDLMQFQLEVKNIGNRRDNALV